MRISVVAETKPVQRGVIEARAPALRLTAHGYDKETALQSLQRGIIAWCEGLKTYGSLEKALRQRNISWEQDGESVSIELSVS